MVCWLEPKNASEQVGDEEWFLRVKAIAERPVNIGLVDGELEEFAHYEEVIVFKQMMAEWQRKQQPQGVNIEERMAKAQAALERRREKARLAFEADYIEPMRRITRPALPPSGPTLAELLGEEEPEQEDSSNYIDVSVYGEAEPSRYYYSEFENPFARTPELGYYSERVHISELAKTGENLLDGKVVEGKGLPIQVEGNADSEYVTITYQVVQQPTY